MHEDQDRKENRSTWGRTRTGMGLPPKVFETFASTNFATQALCQENVPFQSGMQTYLNNHLKAKRKKCYTLLQPEAKL